MKNLPNSKPIKRVIILLFVGLLCYLLGIKLFLIPIIIVSFTLLLPFPLIFRSLLSRFFISSILLYGIIQIAIVAQFYLAPQSGFATLSIFTAILSCAVLCYGIMQCEPEADPEPRVWVDRKDIVALCTALVFMLPFSIYSFGHNSLLHITSMASVQVPDATNHFISLSDLYKDQHIKRSLGYYPKGFDLTTTFLQDTIGLNQTTMVWTTNAYLFIAQYILFGGVLAYSLTYLCYVFMRQFAQKRSIPQGIIFPFILGLGLPLTLFYILPFVFEGFLNFCYVCATIICACIYLAALPEARSNDSQQRWLVVSYFLLIFGTGMSWPLLTPPLLLIPVLYFWPQKLDPSIWIAWLKNIQNAPIIVAFVLQFIPVYIDYRYSTPGSNSINVPGALTIFHYGTTILGIVLTCCFLLSNTLDENAKRFIKSTFVPFILLIGGLTLYQLFAVGQPLYYSIKSDYMLELLTLALLVAWLTYRFSAATLHSSEKLLLIATIPLLLYALLIGISGNPFDDVRKLLRDYSNFGKPLFFDSDVRSVAELGTKGNIKQFNITILHYNADEHKLFANMQPAYWANAIHYDDNPADGSCSIGGMYGNAMYQPFSPQQQSDLTKEVRICLQLAVRNREPYYIVTDASSVSYLRSLFGDKATMVY